MDHNRYEDFARQLLGKNAFLLFQIDKILSQSIKQLAQMPSDSIVQKAFKLFGSEQGSAGHSERHYLANYVEQIVD
jgi:histone deacetylase complex regulatory component SIN3